MADAVTVRTLFGGARTFHVLLTNVSDGTGEAAVVKVDKSALVNHNGAEPAALAIDKVRWSVSGFQWVKLAFDHTADDTAAVLGGGQGKLCFREIGGLVDPGAASGTGDLVLTTGPVPSGVTGTYTILLTLRKA